MLPLPEALLPWQKTSFPIILFVCASFYGPHPCTMTFQGLAEAVSTRASPFRQLIRFVHFRQPAHAPAISSCQAFMIRSGVQCSPGMDLFS